MSLNYKNKLYPLSTSISKKLRSNPTEAEIILWEKLKNRKFHNKRFMRQHPIFYDIDGEESFFIPDFYCHEKKLIVELDGPYHKYQIKNDTQRDEILNLLGFKVIRFINDDIIFSIDKVLEKLANELL